MSIYSLNYRIRSIDVDHRRRLKTSVLFSMLQEAAIAHTEELGMGRDKTLDKGLLWIITHQRAEIKRMPEYGEDVILKSWPGDNMHLIFPRYFSMETASGEPLIKVSALWALMDENTRTVAFPESYSIIIDGVHTGEEIALPSNVKPLLCTKSKEITVPYSFVDLNGHMNNTRYLDVAEDCICEASGNKDTDGQKKITEGSGLGPDHSDAAPGKLRAINTEFALEIRLGETFTLNWGEQDGRYFFIGTKKNPGAIKPKTCFKLSLEYE